MWRRFIILIVLLITLNSCVSYVHVADITVFNPSGEVFCEYKHVYLTDEDFKSFGLNFHYGTESIIISNSMPYVIHYNTKFIKSDKYEEDCYDWK